MATHKNFQPVRDQDDNVDPFFSDTDKEHLKAGFIASLQSGIRVATFLAPIVMVIGIGRMIGNFFNGE